MIKTPTVVPFECEDKDYENASFEEHPLSMPANARIVCCAMPGRGKSSLAKNVLCRGGYEPLFGGGSLFWRHLPLPGPENRIIFQKIAQQLRLHESARKYL